MLFLSHIHSILNPGSQPFIFKLNYLSRRLIPIMEMLSRHETDDVKDVIKEMMRA